MSRLISSVRLASSAFLAFAAVTAVSGAASAVTGTVSGTINMWNKNGNYCPTTATCTGSRYPQADFNTSKPLSNAKVHIFDAAGVLIGQGASNQNGTFTTSWSAAVKPAQIRLRFLASHRDTRFFFAQADGSLYNWFTGLITTAASSSPAAPQAVGTFSAGTSAAPDPFANAYWAAERVWREVFNLVGVLQTNFTNVEIRGFADDIPAFLGSRPTSAASGSTKRVQLDANAGFSPQARVMHEMGHVASFQTHAWQSTNNYNYPNTAAGGGWSQNTGEWSVSAFEEAFATHYGSISFWGDNSVMPTSCLSSATCYSGGVPVTASNLEASSFSGATNNCAAGATPPTAANAPEGRRPISHMRFMWDVFDNRNDGDTYTANAGDFWKHLANLAVYPEGTGANQIDEPWNSARTSVTERDGRGSSSYAFNYKANFANVDQQRTINCTPP